VVNTSTPRIAVCGLGSIGRSVSRLLLDERTGFDFVGAATLEPELDGSNVGEVVGATSPCSATITGSLDSLLRLQPDLVLYATGSFLPNVDADIRRIIDAGADVISPCEELAFPFKRDSQWANEIDQLAKTAGVTVLGTGVNPGFIFDSFVLAASGSSWDVQAIRGRRVVNVSGFGENIHLRLGIGYTQQEFDAGHEVGKIAGHVGFPESIEIIAERLGVTLDGAAVEEFTTMIAETPAPTKYGSVPAGKTEGFVQRATGFVDGEAFIQFELILHLRPEDAGLKPADTFEIRGSHPVNVTLQPGMDAIPATAAQLVNAIPGVLSARSGIVTVKDIPVTSAWIDLSKAMLR
jgi:2,4-diaminopentanoate dehydrogenase